MTVEIPLDHCTSTTRSLMLLVITSIVIYYWLSSFRPVQPEWSIQSAAEAMANDGQAQSWTTFEERVRNYIAPNPSPRNPRISRDFSHPDKIEARLQADAHQTWGYVIYRTTYESEADWTEFLRRLHLWTEDNMDYYNGRDILDIMTWTIFDDRSLFDGADTASIRRHFSQWAESTVQKEQQPPARMGLSPRYRYCVQVNMDALQSAVNAPPPLEFDPNNQGWVKLIEKEWLPTAENPIYAGRRTDSTVYESIEGVTDSDVGW
ncbi:hypothetical protein K431DRAFT_309966, partial [Polychaeton citri CBS 116435]